MGAIFLLGDPTRLMQVMINLTSNAIKFTERGTVTITVFNDDQFITIAVKDTGSGISEENKEKLFKLFGFIEERNKWANFYREELEGVDWIKTVKAPQADDCQQGHNIFLCFFY